MSIEIRDVSVRYSVNGKPHKTVINRVSLNIRQGDFVSLVGPSGCGKSTLLRMIFGSQFPTEGEVRFNGRPVEEINRDRGIVFQKYSVMPNCTVEHSIALGLELDGGNLTQRILHTPHFRRVRRSARSEARELIAKIGLKPEDGDKYPQELSGGMCQRVAIAQALITRPKVLLMDEPFGALDAGVRKGMQQMLLKCWQDFGTTIIFVTHDMEEAVYLGNRVVGLSQLWETPSGEKGTGAVIVSDRAIPGGKVKPHSFKYEPEFSAILAQIQHDVLEPEDPLTPDRFIHDHPDSIKSRA